MVILAVVCLVLAVLVLRARRPPEAPNSSRLYRVDNRVVATVLFVLAVTFVLLAWKSGRPFF
jgi:formate-dependent nitrite reductase membrane component NrfD